MKTFRILLTTLASIFAVAFVLHVLAKEDHGPSSADLTTYSHDDLNLYALRTFARLTAQLTTGDHPAWEDEAHGWRDQCDVGLVPEGCAQLKTNPTDDLHFEHSLDTTSQALLPLPSAAPPADSFPSVLRTIYYNASAARTIQLNKLNDSGQLQQRLINLNNHSAPLSDMTVPDFAPDAMVVKTFWEVIYRMHSGNGHYAGGASLFSKNLQFPEVGKKIGQYPPLGQWASRDTQPFIDLARSSTCESSIEGKHPVYSLGCFYYRPISQKALAQVSLHPVAARTVVGGPYDGECYLILVGVHIMTRETPNWVWMTFWWSNQWWEDPHPSPTVQNKWSLFQPNATINNTDPVANPYLEGPNSGMYSNCLECHRHAVFHPGYGSGLSTQSAPPGGGDPVPRYSRGIAGGDMWNQLQFTGNPPTPISDVPVGLRDLQSPTCYFGGALQTHFLWTIASHVSKGQAKDPCPDAEAAAVKK
jgi:hypothetical protein